jgi:hypothetical protein
MAWAAATSSNAARTRARAVEQALCLLIASACSTVRVPPAVTVPAVPAERSPKYGPVAVPLSRSNDFFRRAPAADFWTLAPYYIAQHNDRACSLAALSMLVNAARSALPLGQNDPLATQPLLESRVNSALWSKALAPGGEGVTLAQLAALTSQSLDAFQLRPTRLEVTHVRDASPEALAKLREQLIQNEGSSDDWMLLNFFVEPYTGVGDYGHIAPVGAYDAEQRRVLVMDPDRAWYEPYWIPDEVALRGMATLDAASGDHRGYVYVSVCRTCRPQ